MSISTSIKSIQDIMRKDVGVDGDKLIELLLKHGVGVKKKSQTLIEIDESYFETVDPEKQIQAEA